MTSPNQLCHGEYAMEVYDVYCTVRRDGSNHIVGTVAEKFSIPHISFHTQQRELHLQLNC
jgi:hypothetical protein